MQSKFRLFSSSSSLPWLLLSAGLFTLPLHLPTVLGLAGVYGYPEPSLVSTACARTLSQEHVCPNNDYKLRHSISSPHSLAAKIVYSTDNASGCRHHPLLKIE